MRPTTEIWANPICPGATDNHWLEFIAAAGAVPDPVTPYDYASRAPDEAIAALIAQLAAGAIDVIAVTGAPQFRRLFDVARAYGSAERLLAGLRKTGIAAIGPHARARLPVIFGIARDCEADHTAAAVGGYGTRSL